MVKQVYTKIVTRETGIYMKKQIVPEIMKSKYKRYLALFLTTRLKQKWK